MDTFGVCGGLEMTEVYGYFWSMWRGRNDRIFNKICVSTSTLADNIITMVFSWVKQRGAYGNYTIYEQR